MDHPSGRRQHGRPTPRTGGLALFGGLFLLRILGISTFQLSPIQWFAVVAMVLLGAWDDHEGLRARPKAMMGLLIACLLAWDASSRLVGHPLLFAGLPVPNHLAITVPLLVTWFWGVPQAFNLADGLDGFALGLAGLILLASGHGPQAHPVLWGLLTAAFLLNYPKPLHFLGDAGSLGLGTLIAILAMDSAVRTDSALALWMCAYLVIDCTTVVVSRLLRHRPLGLGDRGHLHHLLLDACGGRAWMATPLLLALSGLPLVHVWRAPSLWDEVGLVLLMGLGGFAVLRSGRAHAGPVAVGSSRASLEVARNEATPLRSWDGERTSA